MPALPTARLRARRRRGSGAPRVIVLGDLVVDVVLGPARLESGTDVPGRVALRQGGSAATTARWLARLGARTILVTAVGRDGLGRALVDVVRADGVIVHASRVAAARTGRIGVLVSPNGERSFVADRGAAGLVRPEDLRPARFAGVDLLHLPVYSLLGEPLGAAGRRAIELARQVGALVTVDLSSREPLLAAGRRAARNLIAETHTDLLFATGAEAEALLGTHALEGLLQYAPIVVVKRGPNGATVLTVDGGESRRFEVATGHVPVSDSTGAGDAFDAGFIVGWLSARAAGRSAAAGLQRAAVAGHAAARRHLLAPRPELVIR